MRVNVHDFQREKRDFLSPGGRRGYFSSVVLEYMTVSVFYFVKLGPPVALEPHIGSLLINTVTVGSTRHP